MKDFVFHNIFSTSIKDRLNQILIEKGLKYQCIVLIISSLSLFSYASFLVLLPSMSLLSDFTYKPTGDSYNTTTKSIFCNMKIPYNDYKNNISFNSTLTNHFSNNIQAKYYINTWATELNLVCNTHSSFLLLGFIYFFSSIISFLLLGDLPDRLGRKKLFITLNTILFIYSIQLLYLESYYQLIYFAFISGFANFNIGIVTAFITENLQNKDSYLSFTFANSMFSLCGLITLIIIYFLSNWKYQLILHLISLFLVNILSYLYLNESPCWLLANRKYETLHESLKRLVKLNGLEDDENIKQLQRKEQVVNLDKLEFDSLKRKRSLSVNNRKESSQLLNNNVIVYNNNKPYSNDNELNNDYNDSSYDQLVHEYKNDPINKEEYSSNYISQHNNIESIRLFTIFDLLKLESIRSLTLKHCFLWLTAGFCFYSIFLNISSLTNNYFYSAFITYTAQFVSLNVLGVFYTSSYYKIKDICFYSFFFGALFSLLYILTVGYFISYVFIFVTVGFISSSYNSIYLFTIGNFGINVKLLSLSLFIIIEKVVSSLSSIVLIYQPFNVIFIIVLLNSIASIVVLLINDTEISLSRIDLIDIERDNDKVNN